MVVRKSERESTRIISLIIYIDWLAVQYCIYISKMMVLYGIYLLHNTFVKNTWFIDNADLSGMSWEL